MDIIYGLWVLGIFAAIYFAPFIMALVRGVPNAWSIGVIDLFLGWTLIGWVIALAMAARSLPPKPSVTPPSAGL